MTKSKKGFILIILTILSLILLIFAHNLKKTDIKKQIDPVTGQTIETGGGEKSEIGNDFTNVSLTSNGDIFKLGLKNDEFISITDELKIGIENIRIAKIYKGSDKYNEKTKTFTFKINVDNKSNNDYSISVTRIRYNILKISISKNNNVIYENNAVKIDKRL